MTEQQIDKVIKIIQKHTRTTALGPYSCALKNHYPLDYDKCINEIAELIQLTTRYVPIIDETKSGLIIDIN